MEKKICVKVMSANRLIHWRKSAWLRTPEWVPPRGGGETSTESRGAGGVSAAIDCSVRQGQRSFTMSQQRSLAGIPWRGSSARLTWDHVDYLVKQNKRAFAKSKHKLLKQSLFLAAYLLFLPFKTYLLLLLIFTYILIKEEEITCKLEM